MGRETWTKEFIDEFIGLYAKYGRDVDCYEQLRKRYRSQYPMLICNQLTRLRLKRKEDFDKAREEHIIKIKKETSKRERDLLVKARDLNSQTVEVLLNSQQEYLYDLTDLDREDPDYQKQKFDLLKVVTSLQKEINAFSGLDFQVGINEFTQKLIRKKIIEEKDAEFLKSLLMDEGGQSMEDFGNKQEKTPKISFVKDEDDD